MADPLTSVRLPALELIPDGEAVCPECDEVIIGVDVPLVAEGTGVAAANNQVAVFVRARIARLRPCGHKLPLLAEGNTDA
jgi:hypothetical protein